MKDQEEIKQLFKKYIDAQCSKEEEELLFEHLQSEDNELFFKSLIKLELQQDTDSQLVESPEVKSVIGNVRDNLAQIIEDKTNQKVSRKIRLWTGLSAAVIFLCVCISLFFYADKKRGSATTQHLVADVAPGGDKAILTLADGSKIILDDVAKGKVVSQAGVSITKTANGQLAYAINQDDTKNLKEISTNKGVAAVALMNTIATPRGGQFQVLLPDGTKVWLNAATSLKFPLSFANLNERKVELKGEAYFEVTKNKIKPFIVQSDKQTVQVLGTHFNISSYADDATTKTTLLEGSVVVNIGEASTSKINSQNQESVMLKPGQQSQIGSYSNHIKVFAVDKEAEIAWKNGKFSFEDESIECIMKQISRWYDVEVVYKGDFKGKTVWGSITRYSNLLEVLKILELTGGMHFKVEGRRVTVGK